MDQLQILLHEYDSLRAEILERNTVLVQVCVTIGVLSVAVIIWEQNVAKTVAFLVLFACVSWGAFKFVEFDTLAASGRLQEIERKINTTVGEPVLTWEAEHGWSKVGLSPRLKHLLAF
jgi:hypothetical protein